MEAAIRPTKQIGGCILDPLHLRIFGSLFESRQVDAPPLCCTRLDKADVTGSAFITDSIVLGKTLSIAVFCSPAS